MTLSMFFQLPKSNINATLDYSLENMTE